MSPSIIWESLPDFTLADAKSGSIFPTTGEGWDVEKPKISQGRREAALGAANGILSGFGHRVRFFVNKVETSIGIGGTYGQGRRVRDFYPQSLIMPTYQITGQTLDQNDYGLLCEFVHESHQSAMGHGEPIQLDILSGGFIRYRSEKQEAHRYMKGVHKPISASGFVESMPRKHQQGEYAPIFTFGFAVVESYVGIFKGVTYLEGPQKTFLEWLEKQEKPFSQAPKETGKETKATSKPTSQTTHRQQKP